jgi:hypothetical protein
MLGRLRTSLRKSGIRSLLSIHHVAHTLCPSISLIMYILAIIYSVLPPGVSSSICYLLELLLLRKMFLQTRQDSLLGIFRCHRQLTLFRQAANGIRVWISNVLMSHYVELQHNYSQSEMMPSTFQSSSCSAMFSRLTVHGLTFTPSP